MGGIGGIVGTNSENGTVKFAENTAKVEVTESGSGQVGGISGRNYGLMENLKNNGTVVGYIYPNNAMGVQKVGGIVGENYAEATVREAENFGVVSGDNLIGGIAGSNAGTLESVQNNGTEVTAKNFSAGGISGVNSGTITKGSNSAAVKANGSNVGGITGSNKMVGK